MYLAIVQAFAETASFRLPETHTFHKSLPLPGYTTCVGLLGAALGLVMEDAQGFVVGKEIRIGVGGKGRGTFKDLWKYRKVKSGDVISDVLLREYLVDLSLRLVYGAEDIDVVERIGRAFREPAYPLTAGNSDSLMIVRDVSVKDICPESLSKLEFCSVPGDLTGEYKPDKSIIGLPITETVRSPLVFHLPVLFQFDGDKRAIETREPFTFVGHAIQLTEAVQGVRIGDSTVVLR